MAVVTDVLVSTLTRTVMVKPPDAVRQFTPYPRAIINAHVFNGAVSVKPVNDQQDLQIGVVLDPKFAYRLMDVNIHLIQDVAFDWNNLAFIEIVDGLRNLADGAVERNVVELEDVLDSSATGEMWITGQVRVPRFIIQAVGNNTIFFNFFATNQNADVGGAGSLNSLFRFFEYDLEQAEYFALHYATLVHGTNE